MYDIESWDGCLSFIQMSVALNLGSILLSKPPIEELFDYAIKQSKKESEVFRIEYSKKIAKCKDIITQKEDRDENLKIKYNNFVSIYLKMNEYFGLRETYDKNVTPICFSYACLLLGVYGLLGLLIIPVCDECAWGVNSFVLFSLFTSLALVVFLSIELWKRFIASNKSGEDLSKKYLVMEVNIIIVGLLIAFIFPFCPYGVLLVEAIKPMVYNTAIILPYLSFVICFMLYAIDRWITFIFVDCRIKRLKKRFNNLYKEICSTK